MRNPTHLKTSSVASSLACLLSRCSVSLDLAEGVFYLDCCCFVFVGQKEIHTEANLVFEPFQTQSKLEGVCNIC